MTEKVLKRNGGAESLIRVKSRRKNIKAAALYNRLIVLYTHIHEYRHNFEEFYCRRGAVFGGGRVLKIFFFFFFCFWGPHMKQMEVRRLGFELNQSCSHGPMPQP